VTQKNPLVYCGELTYILTNHRETDGALQGELFRVELTEDAKDSFVKAKRKVPGTKNGCIKQLLTLIRRFADLGALKSPDQMREEGEGFFAFRDQSRHSQEKGQTE
jgi:hypothetical protein